MQIDEAREFIKFLHGAVPWNGTWFGEYAPGERGAYWWRKHLDEAIAALIAAPAAPQQAEPVAQIGWSDEFGNLFPMAAWKPAQRTHHDSHKTAWRPVFLHPPAAEVQQAEPVGDFQRSAPGKIWMNLGNDGMDEIEYPTWDALVRADENITWSEDRIDATDIPYVRADLAHPPAAEVQELRAAALALLNELDAGRHGAHEFNNLRNALRGE